MGKKLKVLITGADGFIGRHLTQHLVNKGCEVWANILEENVVSNNLSQLEYVHIVVSPVSKCAGLVQEKLDVVLHLAWSGVKPNFRDNLYIQLNNIELGLTCVNLAKQVGARKIIVPGSTSEYLYGNEIISDNPIPSPIDAYGSVKVAMRFIMQSAAKDSGIQFIYPIITGIYSEDRKDNNVIYYTIDKLLRGEKPSLSALEQKWDYVHIDDVVEALYLLASKEISGTVYPIGHGDNWPLKNYIYTIRDSIDKMLPLGIGEVPYKSTTIPASCIDLTAIRRDTGFEPKIPFHEGVKRVITKIQEENISKIKDENDDNRI